MKIITLTSIILGTSIGSIGAIYGGHALYDYIKRKEDLEGWVNDYRLDSAKLIQTHRKEIEKVVKENDALKAYLNAIKLSLEKGKEEIDKDIKKIQEMKNNLQGRINLVYYSDKWLSEPYKKIQQHFNSMSYLTNA